MYMRDAPVAVALACLSEPHLVRLGGASAAGAVHDGHIVVRVDDRLRESPGGYCAPDCVVSGRLPVAPTFVALQGTNP
jgi:hypothetical protein